MNRSGMVQRCLAVVARSVGALCLTACISGAVQRAAAAPNDWLAAVSGNWSDGTKWSLGVPPSSTHDASIPFSDVTVTFNTTSTVNSLVSAAHLQILGGTLAGSQPNGATPVTLSAGTLTLNGGGLNNLTLQPGGGSVHFTSNINNWIGSAAIGAELVFEGDAFAAVWSANSLSGTIHMANTIHGLQLVNNASSLTVDPAGVIRGFGTISGSSGSQLINNGLISADTAGQTLRLTGSMITNTGTLSASNGGVLSLGGQVTGAGVAIDVDDTPGSRIILDNGNLTGVFSTASGSGALEFTSHSNNYIALAAIGADLVFEGDAFAAVWSANSLSGTIHMASTSHGLQLVNNASSLTVDPAGVIRGFGTISGSSGSQLINNGLISADTAGQTLRLTGSSITNTGTLAASNGGVLSLGGQVTGAGVAIDVDDTPGSRIILDNGNLTGTFSAGGSGALEFTSHSNNYIALAAIGADLVFEGDAFASVWSANSLSGMIHMANTIHGLQLVNNASSLTVDPAGVIRGFGTISGSSGSQLINNGLVSADTAGQTLRLTGSMITNTGTLSASNGGVLSLGGQVTGAGVAIDVDDTPGSRIILDNGNLTGVFSTASGSGALEFTSHINNYIGSAAIGADLMFEGDAFAAVWSANSLSGTIHMASTSHGLQLVNNASSLTVDPAGVIRGFGTISGSSGSQLINNGLISADTAGQTLRLTGSMITNTGTLSASNAGSGTAGSIGGAAAVPNTWVIGSGATVGGVIDAHLTSVPGSVLSPGSATGLITINGDLDHGHSTAGAGGTFRMKIVSAGLAGTDYDGLLVEGNALLGGTLQLLVDAGYVHSSADEFDVITGPDSIVGAFETIANRVINPAGIGGSVWGDYRENTAGPDRYYVAPRRNGDFNGIGGVSGADYTIWADNFGRTWATFGEGDANGDRMVSGADFTIWADNFGQSSLDASVSVPEPSGLGLGALALVAVGLAHRRRFLSQQEVVPSHYS